MILKFQNIGPEYKPSERPHFSSWMQITYTLLLLLRIELLIIMGLDTQAPLFDNHGSREKSVQNRIRSRASLPSPFPKQDKQPQILPCLEIP